jgi:hypothetical protein
MLVYGFLEVKMKLEKKFTVDLKDENNFVSDRGSFSNIYRVHNDKGEVYCGKFPKWIQAGEHMLMDNGLLNFIEKVGGNSDRFVNCCLYEENIARDLWNRFDLAMKPEGVYFVKVKGMKDLFLPAFVNELAIDMNPYYLNESEYLRYLLEKEKAFKKVISDGYYMHLDSEQDSNCFYSRKKGFKFNDFGLWGKDGNFNPYVIGRKNFFNVAKEFVAGKKMEWDLF